MVSSGPLRTQVTPTAVDITAIVLVGSGRPLGPLSDCLFSLGRQTMPVGEILVVLNGVAISKEIQRICAHHMARILVLPEDRGCPEGRNAGASAASTPILLFVDDDGRLDARAVATMSKTMEAQPCAGVVGRVAEEPENEQSDATYLKQRPYQSLDARPTAYFSGGIFAIRREIFLKVGGYWKDSRRQGEELDLALKLFRSHETILYDDAIILYHPTRSAAPSSPVAIATTASGVRVFFGHFPLPVALGAYVWKLGRHAFWLRSKRGRGVLHLTSVVTRAAAMGLAHRDPMTFSEAMSFMRMTRRSPNIAQTRFVPFRRLRARFSHPPRLTSQQ
jgi:GT2 family glycosyltransferase